MNELYWIEVVMGIAFGIWATIYHIKQWKEIKNK